MALKRSEKTLVGITILSLAVFFGYRMEWHKALVSGWNKINVTDSALQEKRDEYLRVKEIISREKEIRALHVEKVAPGLSATDPNRSPDAQFEERIVAMCKGLGISLNRIDPPRREPIPEVVDYEYIVVNVNYRDPWPQVVKLLRGFHDEFYLIKEINITNTQYYQSNVKIDIVLAHVVPLTEEERKARKEAERKKKTPTRERGSTGTRRRGV